MTLFFSVPRDARVLLIPLVLLALAIEPCAGQAQGRGTLSDDEKSFLRSLVHELRYTDLARLWIDSRLGNSPDREGRAFLEFRRAECDLRDGDVDGYTAKVAELARRYPTSPDAAGVKLTLTKAELAKTLEDVGLALDEQSTERRKKLTEQAVARFEEQVSGTASDVIERLNREVKDDTSSVAAQRDEWEHFRIRAYKLLAEALPEGSREARSAYEKMLQYATEFTDLRYANFALLIEGQLFRALALGALGREEEAAEILELLAEVEPDAAPPYPPEVVDFVRELRLRGMAGFARMWSLAGAPERGVELYSRIEEYPNEALPYRRTPESDSVLPHRIQAEIEEGICRTAADGDSTLGIKIFRDLIEWLESDEFRRSHPDEAEQFQVEVGKGLSRLLDVGAGDLPAGFYYRAGVGYVSRARYDDAMDSFRLGIAAAWNANDDQEWSARCLWEIAETEALLGHEVEAGLAYMQLLEAYGESAPFAAQAAQNCYGYFAKLAEGDAHHAFGTLAERGKVLFDQFGEGVAAETSKLQQAYALEERGKFLEARAIYLSVRAETEERGETVPVPVYYSARAAASRCLHLEARAKNQSDGELGQQAIEELRSLVREAKEKGSEGDRAAARVALALVLWNEGEGDVGEVIQVLRPLGSEIGGTSEERRAGIFLWMTAQVRSGDLAAAEHCFELLGKEFAESADVARAALDLAEAHRTAGTKSDLERAADLAQLFLDHPSSQGADLPVPFLGELAAWMLEGDRTANALAVLAEARKRVGEGGDPELRMILAYRFAQAANAEGRYRDARETLEKLIEEFPDIRKGGPEEAPGIYSALGVAQLGVFGDNRDAKLLEAAAKSFTSSVGVLQSRRRSLRGRGIAVPEAVELSYWRNWLQLLRVWERQRQFDRIVRTIRSFRLSHGGKAYAPGALQEQFDALLQASETKK